MHRRPQQNEQNKLPPLLPEHIGNGKEGNRKCQIVPHGVKGLEIISQRHKQEKAERERIRLLINRL